VALLGPKEWARMAYPLDINNLAAKALLIFQPVLNATTAKELTLEGNTIFIHSI